MKIRITGMFLLVMMSLGLMAQPGVEGNKETATEKSVIEFAERIHDFGTIKSGDQAFFYFVFTNSGNAPLVISNVRSSCGCTVPQWPRVPVLAGKSDSIRVEYNTRIKGAFNKSITVFSNATDAGVPLIIKGNVSN